MCLAVINFSFLRSRVLLPVVVVVVELLESFVVF